MDKFLEAKILASKSAIDLLAQEKRSDLVIGVGSGSTVAQFIYLLPSIKSKISHVLASSIETEKLLRGAGFEVSGLSDVLDVDIYVDSADQVNHYKEMIKGGGGAMTREKILATAARKFICMINREKYVRTFSYKIPVEVLQFAKSYFSREAIKILNCSPFQRENFKTDNGNIIIDLENIKIDLPSELEELLSLMPGVVGNGIFARRKADTLVLATPSDIEIL